MNDIKLTSAMGWSLFGSYDGENWTLHVSNDFGQGASLDAAYDREEVYCDRARTEVPIKPATFKLFERWFSQYDAFTEELEKQTGIKSSYHSEEYPDPAQRYDERHGGPYDRGGADYYYRRPYKPHYYVGATMLSQHVTQSEMTEAEIDAYRAGFDDAAACGDQKDYR